MRCVDRRIEPGLRPAARQSRAAYRMRDGHRPEYDARRDTRIRRGHYHLPAGAYQRAVTRPIRLWSASPWPRLSRHWASRPNSKFMVPRCNRVSL